VTLTVGLMSGTSMDAVDAAAVDFTTSRPCLRARYSAPWPDALRARVRRVADGDAITGDELAVLDVEVGHLLADVANRLIDANGLDRETIAAIGCHGQTVAHLPDASPPATLQLGDANVIAELTGITTINDFRRRDLAAGGEGAPLAPAFHEAVLRSRHETRLVLNLGGIANLSILPADEHSQTTGFDTGPANCLMDGWAQQERGQPFDNNGAWAASARPDPDLLARLLDDPYFARPAPKSTGTQYFSPAWLAARLSGHPETAAAKVQASLLELTVTTIADAVERVAPDAARLLVCGGGSRNARLMQRLGERLFCPVQPTGDFGIPPQDMETMAFAWLAMRTLAGQPGNLAGVTGADGPRVLGAIHPA
jgi:anhydro-N-acetylmuramic acid kinase